LIIYGVCAWQKFNDHEDLIVFKLDLMRLMDYQKTVMLEKADMDKYLFDQAKAWYKQNQKPEE